MANSATPTNQDDIKAWADARGGKPAKIKETGDGKRDGVLRIYFPVASDDEEHFEQMAWGDFFKVFGDNNLAFLHSTESDSTFCKIVNH